MTHLEALRKYFGYDHFRDGQEALITGILRGQDVLGVLPTGSGKSLCYQIPAVLLEGLTIVVSPLISLMQDQVLALQEAGIPAACLNSHMDLRSTEAVYNALDAGTCRVLYIAPERLETEGFLQRIHNCQIALLAVDEAHCISQWGQDFRPSYLKIREFLLHLPKRPIVAAFTATATETVRKDIVRLLGLVHPLEVVTGFDRPNLYFGVELPEHKDLALLQLLRERKGKSGIVYCATRKEVEETCAFLQERGLLATRYHAGLSREERFCNQEDFRFDRCRIMVATNAFGMGIDKSNVSFVIHYTLPTSLEAYYQEAGRAGRDGEPADCILLFRPKDARMAKFLIELDPEEDQLTEAERQRVRKQDLRRLRDMLCFCRTTECLRKNILRYFGQRGEKDCGNCSNCRVELTQRDMTREAQMILSCIYRVRRKLGHDVKATMIIRVLTGSTSARISALELDQLSTYGLMQDTKRAAIRTYIERLEHLGYVVTRASDAALVPTEKAAAVLLQGETVTLPERKPMAMVSVASPENTELLDALKAERTRLARRKGIPPYLVCTNATLSDMAARHPLTERELLLVSGMGRQRTEQYGAAFLAVLQKYAKKIV